MENDLILTQESSPAKIREYFQFCLYMMRQGADMPVGLSEVWQLAFGTYEEAEEELKKDFIEGIDFDYSPKNKEYSMTVTCAEGLAFRKKPHLRFIFREVFYQTIYEQTKSIRSSYNKLSREYKRLLVKYEKALDKIETAKNRYNEVKKKADEAKKESEEETGRLMDEIKRLKNELKMTKKLINGIDKKYQKDLARQEKDFQKMCEKEMCKQIKKVKKQSDKEANKRIKKALKAAAKGGIL